MFTSLLLAASPVIVTGIVSALKRLPVIDNLTDGGRVAAIRLVAALFSFGSASVIFWLGGDPVNHASVEEFVLAFITFLGAIGSHSLLKKKDNSTTYVPV